MDPAGALPQIIGKYRVLRKLGKGGMGIVYEAFDPLIERRVAIKRIMADAFEGMSAQDANARFRREAQASGRLNHPNIVSLYEYDQDQDGPYIVMEYVRGRELQDYFCARHRFALDETLRIMRQLLAALGYAHQRGVVHRDIKPANLLLQANGILKVMDFGIARVAGTRQTQGAAMIGTPTHMAPEQIEGRHVDARADLWSAAIILYELLTGTAPFEGNSPATVLYNVVHAPVIPPSQRVPMLAPSMDGLLVKALDKSAAARFQTADEFCAALIKACGRKGLAAPPDRPGARFAVSAAVLKAVQASLSRYIGPLGAYLAQQTCDQAASSQDWLHRLTEHINDPVMRSEFQQDFSTLMRSEPQPASKQASPAPSITTQSLKQAETDLARYVGPLARHIIKALAHDADDVRDLYSKLARHIDAEADRKAFLKSAP